MIQRDEVQLADPVAKHLSEEAGGKEITLADLATHTPGLPVMPDNFVAADSGSPYADYSIEQLY